MLKCYDAREIVLPLLSETLKHSYDIMFCMGYLHLVPVMPKCTFNFYTDSICYTEPLLCLFSTHAFVLYSLAFKSIVREEYNV